MLDDEIRNVAKIGLAYLLLTASVGLFALAGYSLFTRYSDASQVNEAGPSLYITAAMAGIAALFSPCSFPLLLTLLSREGGDQPSDRPSYSRLLRFSLAFSLGTSLFLLLFGAAIALGLARILQDITFSSPTGRLIRTLTGLVLLWFGWRHWRGKSINAGLLNSLLQPLWQLESRLRKQRPVLHVGMYGFGYILAGFG